MIDYKSFRKACKEMGLNPNIFGDNPFVDEHPLETFKDPFDFTGINFPQKNLDQVMQIGQIIYNLNSQIRTKYPYNLMTKKGKEELKRDNSIEKVLPVLQESIEFWLESGLNKCKSNKKLVIHKGRIFEIDPGQIEKTENMNSYMEGVHQDFILKEAMS